MRRLCIARGATTHSSTNSPAPSLPSRSASPRASHSITAYCNDSRASCRPVWCCNSDCSLSPYSEASSLWSRFASNCTNTLRASASHSDSRRAAASLAVCQEASPRPRSRRRPSPHPAPLLGAQHVAPARAAARRHRRIVAPSRSGPPAHRPAVVCPMRMRFVRLHGLGLDSQANTVSKFAIRCFGEENCRATIDNVWVRALGYVSLWGSCTHGKPFPSIVTNYS